ncbi:transketolase [Iocasia frigidifontis]|uniref:Transketolase n=1 Tax=Iocasia fonsfrigidae TaxID=2682810 RepID=A0A8A7KMP7_9FIRM|nr:transketolase [Iocasia fonsfrigidae]QTL99344.1 transketolase [Iocasia fonsfrigidae]
MDNEAIQIKEIANKLRLDVVRMVHLAGDGHPGPALSIADIVATLYYKVMNIDPKNPDWSERDRLILSKGHACPIIYAALARKGYFSTKILPSLRKLGSILQGHPDMIKTPGIDMTSGSLGNGISIASGMVAASRVTGYDYNVYVITGDGELQEGVVWEAAMSAAHFNLGKLIVFVDNNGFQSGGAIKDINSTIIPVLEKWKAFGWHCQEIDGHNINQILAAIEKAKAETKQPSVIVAKTIKGKGLPFMENDNSWHKRTPTEDELNMAIKVFGGVANE